MTPTLSVLIPTLEKRKPLLDRLLREIERQVEDGGLSNRVEILVDPDRGEASTGAKRNALMHRAAGEFIAFVDDDDRVSADYIPKIFEALSRSADVDCVGIRGVITFRGRHSRPFTASLRYDHLYEEDRAYFRPPYHLNPTRTEIALRYPFENISFYEDVERAIRMIREGALRREVFVDAVLYHYLSRRPFAYQRALDSTQGIRHALGLEFANLVRGRRWVLGR